MASEAIGQREQRPTVRQVYAVARALCQRCGEEFPESRAAASELIGRLRDEGPGERDEEVVVGV